MPTASIVIPVRNAAADLRHALAALNAQSSKSFEVVIVDDHSTDETVSIVANANVSYPLRLVEAVGPPGVAAARNQGLAAARGNWIWFADADDRWSPGFVQQMVGEARESGSDLVLCGATQTSSGPHGADRRLPGPKPGRYRGDAAVAAVLADTGALWNKVFRREMLGSQPFPALASKSDQAGLAGMAHRVRTVSVLGEALYQYVRRPRSISNGGVVEPANFLVAIARLDDSMEGRLCSRYLRNAVSAYKNDALARLAREVWRFPGRVDDAESLLELARKEISVWRAVRMLAHQPWAALTCLGVRASPEISGVVVNAIGRRIWTKNEGRAS